MEDYAIPRPANPYHEEDENSIPKYVNVGRSVESELRYIAFQEEREREMHTSETTGEFADSEQKSKTSTRGCLTGEKGRCTILVSVEIVTLLISLTALILGAVCITKLGSANGTTGVFSGNSSNMQDVVHSMGTEQSLPTLACFSNSTVCDAMNDSECSVTIIPQNATVSKAMRYTL